MDAPIEVLRIEHSVVTKELARFRACDNETRCYFCREWAQFIYKKHFVWNAKTQEEVTITHSDTIQAGHYQINLMSPDAGPVKQKQRSAKMFEEFRKLLESKPDDKGSLTEELIAACQLWITLPSNLSGLPDSFEPIQFNPYPDAIPLVEDPKEPSQLLDPLIIERQALCLPSEGFHLLKNLTGDILLSHSQPTCDHIRPESKTPAELDIERDIINEKMENAVKKALVELEQALDHSWRHLNGFMDQVLALEEERNILMGERCQESVDAFVEKQGLVSFKDYWSDASANFKKKKNAADLEKVDRTFTEYFDGLASCAQEFQDVFVTQRLEAVRALVQKLWDLVVPTIQQMADRMASHEQQDEGYLANCKAVSASLKDLHPTNDVAFAAETIQLETSVRVKAFLEEIQALKKAYAEESRPNVAGRLDKINNKDFKKRLKKVESEYYSMRQNFRYQLTKKIFPEALFCKFSLVCIEALMQEGEVMEAVTIEREVKRFLDSHQELIEEREFLLEDFEEGVQTGRRELAGVLGKLFLKEGMRIQGENLAVKRQNMLLKSMGVPVEEQPEPKKKKNKKKKANGASSSVQPSPSTSTLLESKSLEENKRVAKEKSPGKIPEKSLNKPIRPEQDQKEAMGTAKTMEKGKNKSPSPVTADNLTNKDERIAEQKITQKPEPKAEKKAGQKIEQKIEKKAEPKVEKKAEPKVEKKAEPKIEKKAESRVEKKAEPKSEKKAEPKTEKKAEAKIEQKAEPKTEKKAEPKIEQKAEPKAEKKAELKTEQKAEPKIEKKTQPRIEKKAEQKSDKDTKQKMENKVEQKIEKAQPRNENVDISSKSETVKSNKAQSSPKPKVEVNKPSGLHEVPRTSESSKSSLQSQPVATMSSKKTTAGKQQLTTAEVVPAIPAVSEPAKVLPEQEDSEKKVISEVKEQASLADAVSSEKEAEVVNFSLKNLLKNTTVQPPGLSKDISNSVPSIPTSLGIPSRPPALPAISQHEFPSPDKLLTMNQENLIMMIQNLHRENAQLIQTILSTQQEMTMMTGRYSELMTLSREREAQTLQLFEARKQTEMEEARRYILSLEARINTLENQLKSTGKPGSGITAGFGNQDLFAGYREEMQSNHHRGKRSWKKPVVVRCGNCGGSGHTSAECQDVCRYCGSVDHLSEACKQAY
ncbi:hypothetical protein EC973_006437 [Apophysomyces ossiformis]|uniref:CCHC-type domain-containing protein n=1 Tax=Apophysomyces ossiformis TaxID=679940 RepID=A0A8H7BQQ6_9FUNG|nr:hypothetical protein EC973_006437 [Apophysomyces ossiformis]